MELVSDDGARFALTVLGPGSVVVDVLLAAQARPPGSARDGYPDRPVVVPLRLTVDALLAAATDWLHRTSVRHPRCVPLGCLTGRCRIVSPWRRSSR